MKCLHILPMNKLSGAERMALVLCKNLKKYEPIVVCGGKTLEKVFSDNGIKSYTCTFSNKRMLSTLKELNKIIKENNVKIIHAHDNNASVNAYLVKKMYKLDVKIISHIHNCYQFLKENGVKKYIDKILRPKYDYNIACGKLVYDFYKENTSYFQEGKTSILSNAIDIEEITKGTFSDNKEGIEEFNIPKDKVILGFIGRLDEQKGLIPFIKEFARHKEKFEDCRVLLVGNGAQENEIKKLIYELGLQEVFVLVGFQNNTYKFYPIIDILFLPSLYEGLPMVLLEAMAFKKTIVSMDVGSINEIIIDNKTGILIEEGNYTEFVKVLNKLKSKEIKRKELSYNAFKYVSSNYDIKWYKEAIEKIYDNQIYNKVI